MSFVVSFTYMLETMIYFKTHKKQMLGIYLFVFACILDLYFAMLMRQLFQVVPLILVFRVT